MKFFDTKAKNPTWYNRNYFYIGTILIIVTQILLFAFFGSSLASSTPAHVHWEDTFNFANLYILIGNCLGHSSWMHVLMNMLCLTISGLYIERKTGSINFVLIIFVLIVFNSIGTTAINNSFAWIGFSGVNYSLHAFVIVDYLFSLRKKDRNKFDLIFGGIILLLSYCFMSGTSDDSGIKFVGYPVGLLFHNGHADGFVIGIIITLLIHITKLNVSQQYEIKSCDKKILPKTYKIIYSVILVCILSLVSVCTTFTVKAINRTTVDCTINIDCNINEFDYTINYKHDSKNNKSYFDLVWEWREHFSYEEFTTIGYELYLDESYTKPINNDSILDDSDYPFLREDTLPLAVSTTKTIYIKISDIHIINFENIVSFFNNNYDIFYPYKYTNKNLYSYYSVYSNYTVVKNGEDLKFKFNLSNNNYNVYANGNLVSIDSEGYFVLSNITEDLIMTIEEK